MANDTTNQTPTIEKIPDDEVIAQSPFNTPVTVSRNGVSETLQTFVGKKGKWTNTAYAAVQVEADLSKEDIHADHLLIKGLTFIGKANLINMLNTWLKRAGQDIYLDSIGAEGTPDEGKFILDAFKNGWANLAAAAMKLSELEDAVETEQKKFMDFVMNVFTPALMSSSTTEEHKAELKAQSEVMTTRINGLRQQMAVRSSRRSKEVNTNEVRPES
jgi:hypothetical protein